MKPRDRKELARFVRVYGRATVVNAAETIPLPAKRGRPSLGDLPREEAEDIAWFIYTYAEHHRSTGSKKPIEDAFRDLYEVLASTDEERKPGHFERWFRTMKRKRSYVRHETEQELILAEETAKSFPARRKIRARKNPGN